MAGYALSNNVSGGVGVAIVTVFGFFFLAMFSIVCLNCFPFFLKRFAANLRAGQVPKSFIVRVLPFWLPFFWGLAVTVVCLFCAVFTSLDYYVGGGFWGFPQYFLFYAFSMFANDPETFWVLSNATAFFIAIAGTIYVSSKGTPVPKLCGLICYLAVTLLLCGLAGLGYYNLRQNILHPRAGGDGIVREEPQRISHWFNTGDTDLSAYIPFAENNKLVKVESPTLVIESEHPRILGAFSLYPVCAAAVEAIYSNAAQRRFNPAYSENELTTMAGTSSEAFESLLRDNDTWRFKSDMIFMFQPSEKQLQQAADRRIELITTPIGYEAFVFFVNTNNPADNLTLEQILDIYSKKITQWNEVGGKNERILPFQRPEGSGSQTAMLRLMGDVPIISPLREEFREGMGGIVESVADYRNYGNSIGFSFRHYVENLYKHEGIKLLKINGVAPTIESIQNGSYPLISELVIMSRADNTNPNVPKLTEWFLSPQGQKLVRDAGYVPK